MCLDKQNNNFAHSAQFFGHISLPSVHDHDVNLPIFKFCWGSVTRQRFSNSSFKLGYISVEFDSRKINQILEKLNDMEYQRWILKKYEFAFYKKFSPPSSSPLLKLPGRSKTMQKRYHVYHWPGASIHFLRDRKECRFGAWMLGVRSSLKLCLSWNNFKIPPPKFLINDTAKDANTIFEASLSLP